MIGEFWAKVMQKHTNLQAGFRFFDRDHKNFVTLEDFLRSCELMGFKVPNAQIRKIFNSID